MAIHPHAGQPPQENELENLPRLVTAYYTGKPDLSVAAQRVSFGTSGHRGSSLKGSFNEDHILAITQAICDLRREFGAEGPLFVAKDTHALSEPAMATALEALAANGVAAMIDTELGYTPTPALSHAILTYNAGRTSGFADGIVITPSHNPPADGGFKYNPPNGGPADTGVTGKIQNRANAILADGLRPVQRIPYARALTAATTQRFDYVSSYVNDLGAVVDLDTVRSAGLSLCADPLGGAGIAYWGRIAERYGLHMTIRHDWADATFRFMTLDWDGAIRMDCSSPYAMAGLIALKDKFDVAWACDTDHDRHGIVTRSAGLLNPNHYLAAAISYLFLNRPGWKASAGVGKTMVSSSMIDRVAPAPGPPAVRSAGRLQVVRGRAARWLARVWRRRERRAHRFCAATERRGAPTRTASSSACWRRKCWRGPAATPARFTRSSPSNSARRSTNGSTPRPRRSRRRGWPRSRRRT